MFRFTLPVFCLFVILLGGCGPSGPKPPKTYAVKGQVKLDDKPMPDGEILFAIPNQVPRMFAIKDGAYSGSAPEGKSRVEIRAYRAAAPVMMMDKVANEGSMENWLPDQYNVNSTLTADVTAGGANEFKFEVTSK